MALDRKEQFIDVFTELEEIAKTQSVKSSNELDGTLLNIVRCGQV